MRIINKKLACVEKPSFLTVTTVKEVVLSLRNSGLLRRVYKRPGKIWSRKNIAKLLETRHFITVILIPSILRKEKCSTVAISFLRTTLDVQKTN